MRVLIADDSELLVQRLMADLATVRGVEVIGQAGSVDEAVKEVGILKPDVLILDIAMPGGCGIDVLESLEGRAANPVVIVLTNYDYPQYRKKCFGLGARFFFDKSTEFEKVRGVLSNLTESEARRGSSCEMEKCESSETAHPTRSESGTASSAGEIVNSPGKPQLIIDSRGNHQSVYYRCSHCLHEFPLPEDQPPRVAAAELIRGFREHVQQDHPDPALVPVRDCRD